ncbi:MAG: methyltransferase family protein, partial [Phycicoccus sp.]
MGNPEDAGAGPAEVVTLRLWPPFAVLGPWLAGLVVTTAVGDPVRLDGAWNLTGWLLLLVALTWNAWVLVQFHRHETGFLPGESSEVLMTTGPYRRSRNPWYLGLLAGYVGLALIVPSVWAVALFPIAVGLLLWGAVLVE